MKRLLWAMSCVFFIVQLQGQVPSTQLLFPKFNKNQILMSPNISFDGQKMVFVVLENNVYTIYESQKENDKWGEPVPITIINRFLGDITYKNSPVYNYDATEIYFEAQNTTSRDIYVSKKVENRWTDPKLLPRTINTEFDEAEPCISVDNNSLYFIRMLDKREKQMGTIFVSNKNNDQWDTAKAIVDPITIGKDKTPRILVDNSTLLFASKRDENTSDFTLYYAKRLFGDSWLLPKPIGRFSKNDEIAPTIDLNDKKLYLASVKGAKVSQILYTVLPTECTPSNTLKIKGKITNQDNKVLLNAPIVVRDPISLDVYSTFYSNDIDGSFMFFLPTRKAFIIDFTAPNHSHYFYYLTDTLKSSQEISLNISLFDNVDMTLKSYDNIFYEPIDVKISIYDEKGKLQNLKVINQSKGVNNINFPIGKKYNIVVENQFSLPDTVQLDLSRTIIYKKIEKNVELKLSKYQTTIKVVNLNNGDPVECTITITNKTTQQQNTYNDRTDKNGNITITGRYGDSYSISISPKGYAFYNLDLTLADTTKSSYLVKLMPLSQNTVINLKNINFETNSAELKQEAYVELQKVVELMKKNPNIKVEISAHTDDKGTDTYNNMLSERRAKSVVDYLVQNEIPQNRLISKGYGKTKPLVPNTSEQNRAINRRVELKIVEITN